MSESKTRKIVLTPSDYNDPAYRNRISEIWREQDKIGRIAALRATAPGAWIMPDPNRQTFCGNNALCSICEQHFTSLKGETVCRDLERHKKLAKEQNVKNGKVCR